jgi:hypothetical protein
MRYLVKWETEIKADNAEDAAIAARTYFCSTIQNSRNFIVIDRDGRTERVDIIEVRQGREYLERARRLNEREQKKSETRRQFSNALNLLNDAAKEDSPAKLLNILPIFYKLPLDLSVHQKVQKKGAVSDAIFRLRELGLTGKEIASAIGVSQTRAFQLIWGAENRNSARRPTPTEINIGTQQTASGVL